MNRLIFIPQYPAKMRYQEWFIKEFEKEFKNHFDVVITLGGQPKDLNQTKYGNIFSPIEKSIKYELQQIEEYMNLDLQNGDTLFLNDLSFPGFFANALHHKKPSKCFAYCHATSLNNYDYFQLVKLSKWKVECGQAKIFDKVFVATEYHKEKLGWKNIEVVALPEPPFKFRQIKEMYNPNKSVDIFSASRPTPQKVNEKLEKIIEALFGKIERYTFDEWRDYYVHLTQSKILLITTNEETFGYQAMDAVLAGCTPIAPNKFSYPELLPREYLYNDSDELIETIEKVLNGELQPPKELLCQDLVDNFYKNIIGIMKGE